MYAYFIKIIIAYIQTPHSWNILSYDEQKHPKIHMYE